MEGEKLHKEEEILSQDDLEKVAGGLTMSGSTPLNLSGTKDPWGINSAEPLTGHE